MCDRCAGTGWICEVHPHRPFLHDDCPEPGDPCPACSLPGTENVPHVIEGDQR